MNEINGIPYSEVKFDKDGHRQNSVTIPADTTDVIVVSHGWNNDQAAAEDLYTKLFTNFAKVTANDPVISKKKIAIVGVIWPSKRFDELMTQLEGSGKAPAGAKSLSATDQAEAQAAMLEAIERAVPLFDDPGDTDRIEKLRALVPQLEEDGDAQEAFVSTLRELIDPKNQHLDERNSEDNSDIFFDGQARIVFQNSMQNVPASASGSTDTGREESKDKGATDQTGGAKSFGASFSKAVNAVVNLMNLSTYYEMKQRAGTVGKTGIAPLIDELANQVERIHLAGHSFGGRVVSAAAANSTTNKLFSMSLLQAAFSQNGFSKKRQGFFRSVIANHRVTGPISVTNTKKDLSVGLAYPAA